MELSHWRNETCCHTTADLRQCTVYRHQDRTATWVSQLNWFRHITRKFRKSETFRSFANYIKLTAGTAPSQKRHQIRRRSWNRLRVLSRSTHTVESESLGVNIPYILHQERDSSIFLHRSQADREEFRENWCDRKGEVGQG